MLKTGRLSLWLLSAVLLLPAMARAQLNSSISGVVSDETGGVLPGVTVEAASPALIEKVKTTVTDGSGKYQIVDLQPGMYTVTFSLAGFSTVKREGITLTAGFAAPVNVQMSAGAISETITVSGAAPVVDIRNATQSTTMTRDVVDVMPTARVIGSLMTLVPGVTITTAGGPNVDAGGTAGYTYAAAQIHGSSQYDQTIGTYGIPMTLIDNIGKSRINLPDSSVQEYDMKYSTQPAELAYGGFTVNAIPKNGGNNHSGSIYFSSTGHALNASNIDSNLRAQGITVGNTVKHLIDVNPVFGGPIMKDKIWFFGGARYQNSDSYIGGMYANKDPNGWVYTPDYSRPAHADQISYDYDANLTYQATTNNKFNVLLMRNVTHWIHSSVTGTVSPEGGQQWYAPGKVVLGKWTSTKSSRLLIDVVGSYYAHDFVRNPTPEATRSQIVDQGSGITFGGMATSSFTGQIVYTTNASVSYVTAVHNFKVGWNWAAQIKPSTYMTFGLPGTRAQCGVNLHVLPSCPAVNASYRTLNGVPNQVTYYTTPWPDPQQMNPAALYAQDQMNIGRWTINAGLRYDIFHSSYPTFDVAPAEYLPIARHYPGAKVLNWKDLDPRLAVSFDLFGDGKTALKAGASRFVVQEATTNSTALVVPTRATVNSVSRTWTDDGDYIVQGDPLNPAANSELGPSSNANFGKQLTNFHLDPKWANGFGTRNYDWEFMGALQHEVAPNISAQVAYYRRIFGNFTVQDNTLVSPSDYDPYCIMAPADPRLPNGGGQQICGLYDLNPSKVSLVDTVQRSSSYYGKQQLHYNGVDVTINARLRSGGVIQGGYSAGKTMSDNCDVVTKINNPSTYQCHKESAWTPQLKLIGSHPLPLGFRVSGTYQTQVLDPINNGTSNFGYIANYVATNAVVAPSLKRNLTGASNVTVNVLAPGVMYEKRSHQVDLRFSRTFSAGTSKKLQANFDVYNVLNANFVATRNGTYGTDGANWLKPGAILPARLLKFGAQLDF